MSDYKRKCANWIESFVQWSIPRSEAPESFILWTALFTLSAAVRRHVKVPKKYMGSYEISPNLYVIFVAPPGRARKSTTANYAEDLLDELHDVTKSPTIVTTPMLINRLSNADDSAVYILSAEFASFIKKSGVEMFEFLTDIFDGRKQLETGTISRGVEFSERPCVNLLAATTPKWIAENMPESVIGGGFSSRVVFIYEERVRRRQLYYEEIDREYLDKLRQDLVDDLKHISEECHGEFALDDEAKAFMEGWYNKNAESDGEHPNLDGYFERKPAHIHKVAMLHHLACSDELVLNERDFKYAIKTIEMAERRLPKVFENTGKNEYSFEMKDIYKYICDKGENGVEQRELSRKFMNAAQPKLLEELIAGLLKAGLVETELEGLNIYFKPRKVT